MTAEARDPDGRLRPMRERRGVIGTILLVMALAAVASLASAGVAPAPARAGVAKGIVDAALEAQPAGSTAAPGMIREIRRGLGAGWVRMTVSWAALEPERGAYSQPELQRLDALIKGLHAAGVKVILTVSAAPTWAQDSSLWEHPPAGVAKGPQPFYAVRSGALRDYERLGTFLARRFKGRVQALECWNEPNLWSYIYPQRTAGDPSFAARVYLRMLKAFHEGVRRARAGVLVIAGATAPVGLNDIYRTSPQSFARFLQRNHAGRYFDVYSHHPYTPGGSLYPAPGQPPNDPSTTVTLGNLRTLLRLFPRKPFYLTEYGYATRPCVALGGFAVSEADQARYLRQAYRVAASYRQVKLVVWFLLRDQAPAGDPEAGVYSGLRRANGERKPSWYSFKRL
jgi:Cellulase (glycosyl hydrolase family 5)